MSRVKFETPHLLPTNKMDHEINTVIIISFLYRWYYSKPGSIFMIFQVYASGREIIFLGGCFKRVYVKISLRWNMMKQQFWLDTLENDEVVSTCKLGKFAFEKYWLEFFLTNVSHLSWTVAWDTLSIYTTKCPLKLDDDHIVF